VLLTGVGEVIKGWDRGVEGMRVGDKRKLVIPPQVSPSPIHTAPLLRWLLWWHDGWQPGS